MKGDISNNSPKVRTHNFEPDFWFHGQQKVSITAQVQFVLNGIYKWTLQIFSRAIGQAEEIYENNSRQKDAYDWHLGYTKYDNYVLWPLVLSPVLSSNCFNIT